MLSAALISNSPSAGFTNFFAAKAFEKSLRFEEPSNARKRLRKWLIEQDEASCGNISLVKFEKNTFSMVKNRQVGVVMRYLGQFPSELKPEDGKMSSDLPEKNGDFSPLRSDLKETIIPELLEEDPSCDS